MKPAACSWRVSTSLILECRSDSMTSRFSSPGSAKMHSTPSFSSAATSRSDPLDIADVSPWESWPIAVCWSRSGRAHGLDIHEFTNAEMRQFAAVAAGLDAAERQTWIGTHIGVDEARAGLEPVRSDCDAAGAVARENGGSQAELAIVGNGNRMLIVARGNDRSHRPEQFLGVGRHAGPDVCQDRRRIE